MKKACASINGAAVPTAGPGGAARGRSSSRQSRGTSCFAGRLVTLFAALLLAACGPGWFPPGKARPVSPDSSVVFGKVVVKRDVGTLSEEGLMGVLPSSYAGRNEILAQTEWAVKFNEYFYVVLPKEDQVLWSVAYAYKEGGFWDTSDGRSIDCSKKVGFHVPQDASAVYVGTLVFEGGARPWPDSLVYGTEVTLSVKDEYEQAAGRLRARNPDFSGSIVKSLFRLRGQSGFTGDSPASDATISCGLRDRTVIDCLTLIPPFVC